MNGLEIAMIAIVSMGVLISGSATIRLWVKNGREAAKRDAVLNERLKVIQLAQTTIKTDIKDIKTDISDQKIHCTDVVSRFTEKISNLEEKIDD